MVNVAQQHDEITKMSHLHFNDDIYKYTNGKLGRIFSTLHALEITTQFFQTLMPSAG